MVRVLIYLILLFAFAFGYVKFLESRVIFYPMKAIDFTPEHAGLAFEDVYFTTADGVKLNGWFIPGDSASYTVLFCHGNAGNIAHRLEKALLLRKLRLNIFLIDYRGYGRSQGKSSEAGLYLDARAGYNYLTARGINPEQIILYGESLGSAAVIDLAAEHKVAAVVVEGGFTRGRDMAKNIYPFLPKFLFTNNFDSLSKISKVTAPKLFIHSRNDEIVPFSLAQRLYQAAPGAKQFLELVGGHNSACYDSREAYFSGLSSFLGGL